jgi:hypothetical protein
MFWGNSPHSPVIFKMQKRVIGILMGIGYRESCRGLFKNLKILPFTLQYILSLLLFIVLNRGYFAPNSVYHNFNTRQKKFAFASCIPDNISEGILLLWY